MICQDCGCDGARALIEDGDDEWKPLCRVCLDRENPDKWEPYDEEEDNEG